MILKMAGKLGRKELKMTEMFGRNEIENGGKDW